MSTHTSPCLLCGCHCNQHLFDDNDPELISNEIEILARAIRRLRILKSQRCRQLNIIHSSTKSLPNEILLSIFQLFRATFNSRCLPQFILGGVCSHWRNLVINEPRFWKTIDLLISDGPQYFSKALSLLRVFKERNGASFELVQLKFQGSGDQTNLPVERLLQSIRGATTSRIALHRPPIGLLQIICNDRNTYDVSLEGLPHCINNLEAIPGFSLPWSALTILKLSHTRINICYDLLHGCPNLIRFLSYDPSVAPVDYRWPSTRHARETYFPQLQHLTWHHGCPEWDNNLLSFCRFPALQYFHWYGGEHRHSLELFHDFTTFLPPSCRIFHLTAIAEYEVELKEEILLQIPSRAEKLICSDFDISTLSVALEMLQNSIFIPSLTFFKWENRDRWSMGDERILEFTQSFNDILRGRHGISVNGFRMEIGGLMLRPESEKHDRKKIYELMDGSGFNFEITGDGYWIMSF